MIVGSVNYWFFFGFLYMLRLLIQDHRRMRVDDRLNFFMLGVTLSLLSHVSRSLWYLFSLLFLVFVIGFFMRRSSSIGLGDIGAVRWVFLGLGYLDPFLLLFFVFSWFFCHLFYLFVLRRFFFKLARDVRTPYFFVLFSAFFLTCCAYFLINGFGG